MLRKLLSLVVLFGIIGAAALRVSPASAQGTAPVLVLDATTPTVDVVVTPTNGAAGVIYVEVEGAQIRLLNSDNVEVLSMTDKRVSVLAVQFKEGSRPHTLHLERLPGLSTARARIVPQAGMPTVSVGATISQVTALSTPLTGMVSLTPANTLPILATDQANMVSLQFPPQDATLQLADKDGVVVLTSQVGQETSGLSVRLTSGQYALTLANRDLTAKSQVQVSLSAGPALMLPAIPAQEVASNPPAQAAEAAACTATVTMSSVNLRSGPGTAYSVLGFVSQNNVLPVGGVNREGGWLLVGSQAGSGWIANTAASLAGSCGTVTVYDIPLRNASAQPVIIKQNPALAQPNGEREGKEHEGGEGGDD